MITSLLSWNSWPAGSLLGLAAGVIFMLCAFLIELFPRKKILIAIIALCGITPLALGGFWFSPDKLGISDWDYYFSYHHTIRETLTTFHVFPFWNPYTCGGTAGLGDPEFPLFTVTFLGELIFGVEKGLRLAIFISTAVGACGMLILGKRLKLSTPAALIAALGAFFGSVNVLEIVEGHQNILAAMWIPWIFWAWVSAYQNQEKKYLWSIACALFLALTLYAGGIYLLMYTAIAFIAFILFAKDKRAALSITLISGILALGLSATKLVPVALWLSEFQDKQYASSIDTLPYLHQILLGRYLYTTQDIIPNQGSGWHEYGAYIGPIILLLGFWGAITNWRRNSTAKFLSIAAILAVLISGTGSLLKPFFDMASFLPRSNISRFIFFAVIPTSLLAGFGLDHLRRYLPWKSAVTVLLIGAAAIDLMSLSYPLSMQAFVLPEVFPAPSPAPAPIAYSARTFTTRYEGADYTRAYAATRAGYGSLSYCSVLSPTPAVRTIHDEGDNGILSVKTLDSQDGTWQLESWNPNTVKATIMLPQAGQAILNANYAKGWKVNGQDAKEIAGRVGVDLPAGTHQLTFQYHSPGFVTGLSITVVTILIISTLLARQYRQKSAFHG